MKKPINTPSWLFRDGESLPKPKSPGRRRRALAKSQPGHPEYVPPAHREMLTINRVSPRITEVILQLHARSLSKGTGKTFNKSEAQSDLNFRSKLFRRYMPEARSIIKRKQGTADDEGGTTTTPGQ